MFNKYTAFINNGLFNHSGVEFVTYYDPTHSTFVACTDDVLIPKHYVKTPYDLAVKSPAMKKFWQSLDDSSCAIAKSFSEKRCFFQFMRDTGLIAYYDEAYAAAAEEIICAWEHDNHLNINWDNIVTNW